MHPHITIEETTSLTEQESDMLLFIVNVWASIRPPIPTQDDPYPITMSILRSAHRDAVLDRIIQAEKIVKQEAMSIYSNLRNKLSIPMPVKEIPKEDVKPIDNITQNTDNVSGSINTNTTTI